MEKFFPTIPEGQVPLPDEGEKSRRPSETSRSARIALAFVAALELAGCAPGRWMEKANVEHERPLHSLETSWLAHGPRDEALNGENEKLYMYGLTEDGEPVLFLNEACATGSEFGVRGGDALSTCGGVVEALLSRKDVHSIAHAHTHSSGSMTHLGDASFIYTESLSRDDLESIRNGQKWQAIPPSFQDLMGLGTLGASELRTSAEKKFPKRVVDASGVWTYEVNIEHPEFKVFAKYYDVMREAGPDILARLDLSESQEQELMNALQQPLVDPEDFLGGDKVKEAYRMVFEFHKKHEQQFLDDSREARTTDLMQEWETKQMELATHPADSLEELRERVEEFIEFGGENGVRLSYEPFEK